VTTELDIDQVHLPADWALSVVLNAHLQEWRFEESGDKIQVKGTARCRVSGFFWCSRLSGVRAGV